MEFQSFPLPMYDLPSKCISFSQLKQAHPAIYQMLSKSTLASFTSLSIQAQIGEHLALPIVFHYIMEYYHLLPDNQQSVLILERFIFKIEEGYLANPYHNAYHAADMLWGLHRFIEDCGLITVLNLKSIDLFSVFVAAAGHDYMHMGCNNMYYVNIRSDLATLYNDVSVLESMHASKVMMLTKDPKYNIFGRFSSDEVSYIRKAIIQLILNTDNFKHWDLIKAVKAISADQLNEKISQETKMSMLSLIFHTSDIGHVAKEYSITYEWALRIYKEFYNQAKKEKEMGIKVTNECEEKLNHKNQATFIQSFYMPSLDALKTLMPGFSKYQPQVEQNIKQLLDTQ